MGVSVKPSVKNENAWVLAFSAPRCGQFPTASGLTLASGLALS